MRRFFGPLYFLCALAVSVPSLATAQTQVGVRGVGLSLGVVEPEDVDAALGFGALVDLGAVARNVHLEAHTSYWWKSEDVAGAETSVRDLSLGMRSKYVFPISNPRLRPFAGGGLGIHFLSVDVFIPEQVIGGVIVLPATSIEDTDTKIGLDMGGGFAYGVSPRASLMTELWYSFVSDMHQLNLRFGVLWKLGSYASDETPSSRARTQ